LQQALHVLHNDFEHNLGLLRDRDARLGEVEAALLTSRNELDKRCVEHYRGEVT
jgi:hypothetical protein